MLFLICHSAPALSVVIWVCSFIKAAGVPASSALLLSLQDLLWMMICWIKGDRLQLQ